LRGGASRRFEAPTVVSGFSCSSAARAASLMQALDANRMRAVAQANGQYALR
jgi:hypothetical protein